jgi:hypothetical protein
MSQFFQIIYLMGVSIFLVFGEEAWNVLVGCSLHEQIVKTGIFKALSLLERNFTGNQS